MIDVALQYLCPPENGFWRWSSDGEALVWRSGQVIVFRAELAAILEPLASHGLPGLSGLLLVMAATRENWPEVRSNSLISDRFNRLHELPSDLRTTANGRRVLLDTLFEDTVRQADSATASEIVRLLHHPSEEVLTGDFSRHLRTEANSWIRELVLVEGRLDRVDATRLRQRMATGVEFDVQASELQLAEQRIPNLPIRELLAQLREHHELQGIAAVARQLIAVLSLPRSISQNDERPHGGVSDITNRGTLDRLLLSELANDDLTLATRIALNEAMYLRREHPPTALQRRRLIVLDCGIRQWGIPRVFATSVALALADTKLVETQVGVFQACGGELQEVELSGVEGVSKSLQLLRFETHIGDCLAAVQKRVQQFSGETEVVVVTSPEGAIDPEFIRALTAATLPALYIVTIQRSGDCQLWKIGDQGRHLLKSLTVDLTAIGDSSPNVLPLIDPSQQIDLPAIVGLRTLPLRLWEGVSENRYWSSLRMTYAMTGDRRLLAWDSKKYGAWQLSDRVTPGDVLFSFQTSDIDYAVIRPKNNSKSLQLLGVTPQFQVSEICLQLTEMPKSFFFHQGILVVVFSDHVASLDLITGRISHTMPLDRSEQHAQRFFCFLTAKTDWFAVQPDSTGIRQVPVPIPESIRGNVIELFEVAGIDGPVALLQTGDLYFLAEERLATIHHQMVHPIRCVEIGSDGRKLLIEPVVKQNSLQRRVCIDVVAGTCEPIHLISLSWQEMIQRVDTRSKRNYFRAVHFDPHGRLFLQVRSGKFLELKVNGTEIRLRPVHEQLGGSSFDVESLPTVAFESCPSPPETGYQLQLAKLPDGSAVFLDSRGMLHLKSSNRLVPESTFVLTERAIAGWNTNGQLVGDEFYLGTRPNVEAADFFRENVMQFIEEALARC